MEITNVVCIKTLSTVHLLFLFPSLKDVSWFIYLLYKKDAKAVINMQVIRRRKEVGETKRLVTYQVMEILGGQFSHCQGKEVQV